MHQVARGSAETNLSDPGTPSPQRIMYPAPNSAILVSASPLVSNTPARSHGESRTTPQPDLGRCGSMAVLMD